MRTSYVLGQRDISLRKRGTKAKKEYVFDWIFCAVVI